MAKGGLKGVCLGGRAHADDAGNAAPAVEWGAQPGVEEPVSGENVSISGSCRTRRLARVPILLTIRLTEASEVMFNMNVDESASGALGSSAIPVHPTPASVRLFEILQGKYAYVQGQTIYANLRNPGVFSRQVFTHLFKRAISQGTPAAGPGQILAGTLRHCRRVQANQAQGALLGSAATVVAPVTRQSIVWWRQLTLVLLPAPAVPVIT